MLQPRRVVYTCLYGGYERLLDQPVAADDVDFVCFTDDATLTSDTWQIRHTPGALPADQNRSSRRPKILTHEYLADYDSSLYIDNSVLLTVAPDTIFDTWLPDGVAMAQLAHSFRGPVREEFDAVFIAGLDAAWICDEQLEHYERHAAGALTARATWNGLLLRRHNDPLVCAAMQIWWEHVLRYSRRDQLSLAVALHATGLAHVTHDVDNHRSEFHVWPREDLGRDPAGGAALPTGPRHVIADLERQLAGRDEHIADLVAHLDAARTESARFASNARSLQAAHDRVAADIAELRASTSWRVTRPLRAAANGLKTLRAARRSDDPGPR